jgi:hypothetical protein
VAIVFGASVYSKGDLSPTLEERVETAITLYKAGKIDRVLVSGDNRHPSYNEPKAMQEYLVTHAVAPQDVIVDYCRAIHLRYLPPSERDIWSQSCGPRHAADSPLESTLPGK